MVESFQTALAGLYFAEPSPNIDKVVLSALGDQTPSERLGKPVDRNAQRDGEPLVLLCVRRYRAPYLGVNKQGR